MVKYKEISSCYATSNNPYINALSNKPIITRSTIDILKELIKNDTCKIILIMNDIDEYYDEEVSEAAGDTAKQINKLYLNQSIKFKYIFDIYFEEKGIHKLISNYVGLYRQYL